MKTRRSNISGDRLTTPRRSTRVKTSEKSLPVPIELVFEIFSRLTLKSIARCRCVSKLWASILRRPDFTEFFLSRSSSRPKILFACEKNSELFFFSAHQPQYPNENSSPVVASYHTKFSFDESCRISGLVHGSWALVKRRISDRKIKFGNAMICNTSTGQAFVLPKVKTRRVNVRSLVGYDPIHKNLKVLSMTGLRDRRGNVVGDEHQVMTLGTENPSWRRIECRSLPYNPHSEICIEGVLYYPTFNDFRLCMIVCFDVKSEKFTFIQVKESLQTAVYDGRMINYNGKLGLYQPVGSYSLLNRTSTSLKFWVLEDVEKQEWSEREYLLPDLWKDLVGDDWYWCVGVTRENEIVLSSSFSSHLCAYLIYFNHEKNTMVRIEIQGIDVSKYDTVDTFLYHVEDVKLM